MRACGSFGLSGCHAFCIHSQCNTSKLHYGVGRVPSFIPFRRLHSIPSSTPPRLSSPARVAGFTRRTCTFVKKHGQKAKIAPALRVSHVGVHRPLGFLCPPPSLRSRRLAGPLRRQKIPPLCSADFLPAQHRPTLKAVFPAYISVYLHVSPLFPHQPHYAHPQLIDKVIRCWAGLRPSGFQKTTA